MFYAAPAQHQQQGETDERLVRTKVQSRQCSRPLPSSPATKLLLSKVGSFDFLKVIVGFLRPSKILTPNLYPNSRFTGSIVRFARF